MFLDVDNSLNTRQTATGAAEVVFDTDLRRGPGKVACCTLLIHNGGSGNLDLVTADGDSITMEIDTSNGPFHLNLQVRRVLSTSGISEDAIMCLY